MPENLEYGPEAAQLPSILTKSSQFCHSSTTPNIEDDFRDALWIVLTQPNNNKNILQH